MFCNTNTISIYILLLFSCQVNYNSQQIELIKNLEQKCDTEEKKIESINVEKLKQNIKVGNINLLQLEEKKN